MGDKATEPTQGGEPPKGPIAAPLLAPEDLQADVPFDEETAAALVAAGRTNVGPGIRVSAREGFEDLIELRPDTLMPDFTYRWVHKHPKQVSRRKAQAYKIVDPKEEVILNFAGEQVHIEADGTYTEGDLILMKCPKQIHSYRRAAKDALSAQRLASETQDLRKGFMRSAKKHGVEVITTREPGRE